MKNQIKALKVKIKSLAAEARIIRLEEKRALDRVSVDRREERASGTWDRTRSKQGKYADGDLHVSLRLHRINDVRHEQRCSLLAYAYLRGKEFAKTERMTPHTLGNNYVWDRVLQLIRKFGGKPGAPTVVDVSWLKDWVEGKPAQSHFAFAS